MLVAARSSFINAVRDSGHVLISHHKMRLGNKRVTPWGSPRLSPSRLVCQPMRSDGGARAAGPATGRASFYDVISLYLLFAWQLIPTHIP